jgi:hypothetical protein
MLADDMPWSTFASICATKSVPDELYAYSTHALSDSQAGGQVCRTETARR